MSTRITVGYDGSSPSTHAVLWAASEAARRSAALHIVGCYSIPDAGKPWIGAIPYDLNSMHRAVVRELDKVVDCARAQQPRVQIDSIAALGAPARQLIRAANGAELLVVGTRGAGEVEAWLLGSVAHTVARKSPCPVVLVPAGDAARSTGRIVIGVDGSPCADAALDWAAGEADLRAAELVVVHAWHYQHTEVATPSGHDYTQVDAALVLDKAVARARARTSRPVCGELVEDGAAPALLSLAANADLLVVGSRGRGGFRSIVFGSVAHAVARRSPCPTAVIRGRPVDHRPPS